LVNSLHVLGKIHIQFTFPFPWWNETDVLEPQQSLAYCSSPGWMWVDMGSPALLPIQWKVCCGFLSPLKIHLLGWVWTLGSSGTHTNHYTTEATNGGITFLHAFITVMYVSVCRASTYSVHHAWQSMVRRLAISRMAPCAGQLYLTPCRGTIALTRCRSLTSKLMLLYLSQVSSYSDRCFVTFSVLVGQEYELLVLAGHSAHMLSASMRKDCSFKVVKAKKYSHWLIIFYRIFRWDKILTLQLKHKVVFKLISGIYFPCVLEKNDNPGSIQGNYSKFSRLLTNAMMDAWLYHFCRFTHLVLHSDEANVKIDPLNSLYVLDFPLKYIQNKFTISVTHTRTHTHTHSQC
jgi:hypothetical protein